MKEPYSAGAAAVGLRLRQQRLKRGWSQEGLCRDICAASYLSKIEQGQVQAAPELLELLFRRLELPWYGESLPELERLVEHRYECLLDGDKEGFRDSREIFAHALDRLLSSPLAADGLVLDAMDRNDPTEIPPAWSRIWTGVSWPFCGWCRTGMWRRCGCCRRRIAISWPVSPGMSRAATIPVPWLCCSRAMTWRPGTAGCG